jgi:hypothetical protein
MFSSIRTIGRRALPLAIALVTLATAACGGGDDSSTGPSPVPSGNATVTVVNHAPTGTVLFLRYRTCGTSQWSADVLGSSILGKNEQKAFSVAAGCYDVRATPGEVGLDYLYFTNVQVAAGQSKTLEITAFPPDAS